MKKFLIIFAFMLSIGCTPAFASVTNYTDGFGVNRTVIEGEVFTQNCMGNYTGRNMNITGSGQSAWSNWQTVRANKIEQGYAANANYLSTYNFRSPQAINSNINDCVNVQYYIKTKYYDANGKIHFTGSQLYYSDLYRKGEALYLMTPGGYLETNKFSGWCTNQGCTASSVWDYSKGVEPTNEVGGNVLKLYGYFF